MTALSRPRHLPLGVAILAVLIALFGVVYLLVGLLVIALGTVFGGFVPHLFATGWIAGLLLILLGVLFLIVARGLWTLELWALVLSLLVIGGLWLSDVVQGGLFSFGGIVLLLLIVYLVAVHREFT